MPDRALHTTISNELTAQLPALNFGGKVVVVDCEEQIEAACRDLASHKILGFDTETRPSFKAGISYKVSLLQISTPSCCYLFRLNKIPFSREILRILESEQIVKLGADVAGDIRSLNELRHFKDRGFLDLQSIIWEWGIEEKSLRKMSALTLGCRISKAQRLSNWEAATLTSQQQNYAATDAWACIEIYNKLLVTPKLSAEQISQIRAEKAILAAEAAARKAAKKAERKAHYDQQKSKDNGEAAKTKPKRSYWKNRRGAKSTETNTPKVVK